MSLMPWAPSRSSSDRHIATFVVVVLSAAIAAGCTGPPQPSATGASVSPVPSPPQLVVRSGEHRSTLTIRDEIGLVTGFTDGAPIQAVREITDVAVANVPDRPAALGVAWVALPCEANPILIIFSEGGRLRMTLDRGPRVPPDCESLGVIYGITLELSEPVAAQAVDIEGVSRDSSQ